MIRAVKPDDASELTETQARALALLDEMRAHVLTHADLVAVDVSVIWPNGDGSFSTAGGWQRAPHIPSQTQVGMIMFRAQQIMAGV